MAHGQLTLKQQLKGVTAALKSPRTPKQLRRGLEKRAKELRKQIKKKGGFWEPSRSMNKPCDDSSQRFEQPTEKQRTSCA